MKAAISWAAVIAIGAAIALGANRLPAELNAIIIPAIAGASGIVSGFAWGVLRRIDELKATQGLDKDRREILRSKVEARRRPLWIRWGGAVVSASLAVAVGLSLKAEVFHGRGTLLVFAGYVLIAIAVALTVLLILEYQALSKLGPALADEMRNLQERSEFLRKVRA